MLFIIKCNRFITKCNDFVTKCDSSYKICLYNKSNPMLRAGKMWSKTYDRSAITAPLRGPLSMLFLHFTVIASKQISLLQPCWKPHHLIERI